MARLVADIKLDKFEQQTFRGSNTSSHGEVESRRASLPSNSRQEQQPGALRHQTSEPLLSQMNLNRELKLGKLLIVGNGVFQIWCSFQNLLCTLPLVEIVQFR